MRQNQHTAPWTKERDAQLAELREQGFSSRQIAVKLGGVTRCAVIGRAMRLGLERKKRGPAKMRPPRKPAPKRRSSFSPSPSQAAVLSIPVIDQHSAAPVALLELQSHHCRWPIGDRPDIVFCGGTKLDGKPYCRHHHEIAYWKRVAN